MRKASRNNQRSGVTYVTVLLLLLIAAIVFACYAFAPPILADWNFRRAINEQMLKAAEKTDLDIRLELRRQAELLQIPIDTGDLDISRYAKEIKIEYKYDREIPVPGLEKLHFENSMKREIKKVDHLFVK